jgi:hypothetical protein
MKDIKGLKKILPKDLQSYDVSVRVYYRFLYVIYYLIKEEFETAERELLNIKKIRGFDNTYYLPLFTVFVKYVETYNTIMYKEKGAEKKLAILKSELQNFIYRYQDIHQLLPGMWIEEKCKELIKSIDY